MPQDIAVILIEDPVLSNILSHNLNLPLIEAKEPKNITDFFAVIFIKDKKICIQQCGRNAPGAIYVDFSDSKLLYRIKNGGVKNQMIAKAIGIKNLGKCTILDATAGLGKDSFILASLGCKLIMCERSEIIYSLLLNGLERASEDLNISNIISNMTLLKTDAYEYIKYNKNHADIVYIDPMFPSNNKSALAKKEMQLFKHIVGKDLDSDKLLIAALNNSYKRIVVKRYKTSPFLAGIKPATQLDGKTNRYDIYL
jgi:16S rRNA (guanine1516-N2)-methyltransferase